jgi:CDP-paratose 2-epimerase
MTQHYVVTGGAGFIGVNCVSRLISRGKTVTIYDNLTRKGASRNITWLQDTYGRDAFQLIVGDVRDSTLLSNTLLDADVIIHLAGQVAVTTSVVDPRGDFEDNALGTFNVLEAARFSGRNPIVLYASTNKVYGGMEGVGIIEKPTRYEYADQPFGTPETYPLDFHSPYGCSKGAGDQYVRDYSRIYDLPTVVFRQSTVYGPRQFGIEDQGWMAWMMIAAVKNDPITIYGDGKQVRDMLFVEDLLDAYEAAIEQIDNAAGGVYNLGGGPANTISIWREFGPTLEKLLGREIPVSWDNWRPGDQRIYVSDIRKAKAHLNWTPKVKIQEGIQFLFKWITENRHLFG